MNFKKIGKMSKQKKRCLDKDWIENIGLTYLDTTEIKGFIEHESSLDQLVSFSNNVEDFYDYEDVEDIYSSDSDTADTNESYISSDESYLSDSNDEFEEFIKSNEKIYSESSCSVQVFIHLFLLITYTFGLNQAYCNLLYKFILLLLPNNHKCPKSYYLLLNQNKQKL